MPAPEVTKLTLAATERELRETDLARRQIGPIATSEISARRGPTVTDDFTSRQLEIFASRSRELAVRVAAGQVTFLDAVDLLYSAAEWAGLVENVGDDVVQAVLVTAFVNVRGA